MSVKERIREFAKNEKNSVKSFEESINASNGYINSIQKSIGLDKLEKIIEEYPNLNIEWLFTGKGKMLKEKEVLAAANPLEATVRNQERQIDQLYRLLEILATKLDISKDSLYKLAGKL